MLRSESTARAPRLHARHAAEAERGAWSVERDIRWDDIDHDLARSRPDLLEQLRAAAVVEAYQPVCVARLIRLSLDDVDAGTALSLELYDGLKHFHALRRYLEAVGHEPPISDREVLAARRAGTTAALGSDDIVVGFVRLMLSEHLASYFFRRLGEQAPEPVLAELLVHIAADDARHAQSVSDILATYIEREPSTALRVLDAAADFHHVGEGPLTTVPVALPGDPVAIRSFIARVEGLCHTRLVDHIKASL
jgi:hypothetical protein